MKGKTLLGAIGSTFYILTFWLASQNCVCVVFKHCFILKEKKNVGNLSVLTMALDVKHNTHGHCAGFLLLARETIKGLIGLGEAEGQACV